MPGPKSVKPATAQWKELQRAALLFKQLGDATRLVILSRLADGEIQVTAMCEELGFIEPTVKKHVVLLRHGGLIAARRDGKKNFYGLTVKSQAMVKALGSLMP